MEGLICFLVFVYEFVCIFQACSYTSLHFLWIHIHYYRSDASLCARLRIYIHIIDKFFCLVRLFGLLHNSYSHYRALCVHTKLTMKPFGGWYYLERHLSFILACDALFIQKVLKYFQRITDPSTLQFSGKFVVCHVSNHNALCENLDSV